MALDNIEDLREYLASLPEEERDKFLADLAADFAGTDVRLKEQMARAGQLRETESPGMRDAGRYKVAANPLEFLGVGGQRYAGERQAGEVDRERREMSGRKENALAQIMRQIREKRTPPGAAPGGVTPGINPMANMLRGTARF